MRPRWIRASAGLSLLAALLLALGGCAASLPRTAPPPAAVPVRAIVVPVEIVADLGVHQNFTILGVPWDRFYPAWGITTTQGPDEIPVKLELDASMTAYPTLARMVAAHEMGHVLGIDAHYPDDPWMCPSLSRTTPLIQAPGDDMVVRARARTAGEVFTLVVRGDTNPVMLDAVRWGAARWNALIGRGVIVLRTAPPTSSDNPPATMPKPK